MSSRRSLLVWTLLLGLAAVCSAGDVPVGPTDQDRVLEAVARQELKADRRLTCVVVLPMGFVDHTFDGGMGMPIEPVSPWLLGRLRRHRRGLQTTDGPCSEPVLWLGPVRFDEPSEAKVGVGGPGDMSGRTSYTVRRDSSGRWRAKIDCCRE
jgi:hypothetical protein